MPENDKSGPGARCGRAVGGRRRARRGTHRQALCRAGLPDQAKLAQRSLRAAAWSGVALPFASAFSPQGRLPSPGSSPRISSCCAPSPGSCWLGMLLLLVIGAARPSNSEGKLTMNRDGHLWLSAFLIKCAPEVLKGYLVPCEKLETPRRIHGRMQKYKNAARPEIRREPFGGMDCTSAQSTLWR